MKTISLVNETLLSHKWFLSLSSSPTGILIATTLVCISLYVGINTTFKAAAAAVAGRTIDSYYPVVWLYTVSYTHLDVYKRQVVDNKTDKTTPFNLNPEGSRVEVKKSGDVIYILERGII